MEWLEPWSPATTLTHDAYLAWSAQLSIETPPGHPLYAIPTKLLARHSCHDALFEILDGSGRVAHVHLTWRMGMDRLPLPDTKIFASLQEWVVEVMGRKDERYLS